MLFTRVIFNTCEFSRESLAKAKLAHSFFMSKNGVVLTTVNLKSCRFSSGLSNNRIFFLLKELFFTSPPTENHSFQACFITVNSYAFCRSPIRQ